MWQRTVRNIWNRRKWIAGKKTIWIYHQHLSLSLLLSMPSVRSVLPHTHRSDPDIHVISETCISTYSEWSFLSIHTTSNISHSTHSSFHSIHVISRICYSPQGSVPGMHANCNICHSTHNLLPSIHATTKICQLNILLTQHKSLLCAPMLWRSTATLPLTSYTS